MPELDSTAKQIQIQILCWGINCIAETMFLSVFFLNEVTCTAHKKKDKRQPACIGMLKIVCCAAVILVKGLSL